MQQDDKEKIIRHKPIARINHWAVVICFLFVAISGLGFFFPSLNWFMNILGTPQLSRLLHPFVGVVMFLLFVFMFFRYFKHNFINRDDIEWAKKIGKVMKNEEAGDVGQYNFGQKGVYWVASICLFLLLLSGIVIWRPYFAEYFSIPVIRIALLDIRAELDKCRELFYLLCGGMNRRYIFSGADFVSIGTHQQQLFNRPFRPEDTSQI